MGFFEDELIKMFGTESPISDARFVGRACVGRLGNTTNVKLQFVTLGTYEKYEGIQATILNRNRGEIDSNVFRFADILGKNVRSTNLNNDMPYISTYNKKSEWHIYKPNAADYATVAKEVNSYLELFAELQHSPEKEKENILYLLYSYNEWCEKSKASLHLITSDIKTLYSAIGGEILAGNMEYHGETGKRGFEGYKKDYLHSKVDLDELEYGFVRKTNETLLSRSDTLSEQHKMANEFLAADFDFRSAEFDEAYKQDDVEYSDDIDDEYDNEI